jgi:cephalosporin hydroxylase
LKIPLSLFLGAVRDAPRGRRIKLLRELVPCLFETVPGSTAEVCEINSLANFESAYPCLAAMLGQAGKTPPPGEMEFLQSVVHRQIYHPGTIGAKDYFFLTAFVSILAPPRVIEIGTFTGFSAAIIAAALSRQHGNERAAWVDTLDIRPQCQGDEARPTGFEIRELVPSLTSMVRLHIPHDSTFVSQLAKRDELKVVFIDADHRHPRPLLDLLRLAPYVQSGGWIVLHDIRLGTLSRKAIEAGQTLPWGTPYGAEWLFDHWPFRKISSGNIGAIQLPLDKSALIPFALRLMAVPFEIPSKARPRRALYQTFSQLL